MREDWTEQLKQKLAGHRKTPPVGLWEGISEQMEAKGYQMGLGAETIHQKTTTKRWYWAVAAVVLALVGFFVIQQGHDSEQPQQANAVTQHPASQHSHSASPQPASPQIAALNPVKQASPTKAPLIALAPYDNPQVSTASDLAEEELTTDTECQTEEVLPDSMPEVQRTIDRPHPMPSLQQNHTSSPSSPSNKWSFGVNASGGLLAAQTSQRTDPLYNSQFDKDKAETAYALSNQTEYVEYVSEHHLPIRFGVNLTYQLSPRLALLSGISYAYLYSKFSQPQYPYAEFSIPLYTNVSFDQKLHYLGVPLGVSYQLWSLDHFQFYITGGVMLEKCLNEKPWQWSVNAAAGAEYAFTRQFGFYLEPSLGYYFNDGTSLQHYYKEHPLTPSIEFGLRMHLNK